MADRCLRDCLKLAFEKRNDLGNKSDFGRLLIIGGSEDFPNAPVISAMGAIRTGCGYVGYLRPKRRYEYQRAFPSAVIFPKELKPQAWSAVLFGNGLANTESNRSILRVLLSGYHGKLVIDATGLDMFKEVECQVNRALDPIILLTPHTGEFQRLSGCPVDKNVDRDMELAATYAGQHNVSLLLKSYDMLGVGPMGNRFFLEGKDSGLAKAGTGDFLAGMIAGLLASSPAIGPLEAAKAAGALLYRAGKLAKDFFPKGSASVDDLYQTLIPMALKGLLAADKN